MGENHKIQSAGRHRLEGIATLRYRNSATYFVAIELGLDSLALGHITNRIWTRLWGL